MQLTEFEQAIIANDLCQIARMIDANRSVLNTPNGQQITPLTLAVSRGTPDMVDLLVAGGAEINARQGKPGTPPLVTAVVRHRQDNLIVLLKNGADVHQQDGGGRTALDWAVCLGYKEMAAVLMRYGSASGRQRPALILFSYNEQNILIENTSMNGWRLPGGRPLF